MIHNSPQSSEQTDSPSPAAAPAITLPKGGGVIRDMGEKFAATFTSTGSLTVLIPALPGRTGFGPQLALLCNDLS